MTTAATQPAGVHEIGCMEIWGGNQRFEDAISLCGLNAWVVSRPYGGSMQGGDIYYISTCGHGHIARFMVADVAGHGAQVGNVAAKFRRLMRRNINKLDQRRFVRALNRDFDRLACGGMFATAVLTSYFAPTRDLLVCNAGHPRPLLYRAQQRAWSVLDQVLEDAGPGIGNLPIGIVDPTEYHQFAVTLESDDLIILYSDWLIEARSPGGQFLGESGLLELAQSIDATDPARFVERLMARVSEFCGREEAEDDVTLIVLHHTGAGAKRITATEWLKSAGKMLGLIKV